MFFYIDYKCIVGVRRVLKKKYKTSWVNFV